MQNMTGALDHLKNHVGKWPATKAELVADCDNLSDFSSEDKKEFEANLPEGTYNTPEEVAKALGWQI